MLASYASILNDKPKKHPMKADKALLTTRKHRPSNNDSGTGTLGKKEYTRTAAPSHSANEHINGNSSIPIGIAITPFQEGEIGKVVAGKIDHFHFWLKGRKHFRRHQSTIR
ncbi:hypothetical protein TNCV_4830581 [Trichonephila clavipes]|nr:hypothetical protein TNCV_4830581 [Trichonephila clavipes]